MKTLILILVLAVSQSRASVSPVLSPSCAVDDSVKSGTNSVVLNLKPTPLEILAAAGLGDSKSPGALFEKLDAANNPLTPVVATINRFLRTFMGGIFQIPACRFKFVSSQLFCDNVPGVVLKALCGIGGNFSDVITKVSERVSFPLPQLPQVPITCETPGWGLRIMNVSAAWSAGYKGAGVTVANIDSGVRSTHFELRDNFRAIYNWFDAYAPTNKVPVDDNGHGTHTMGSMCGKTVGVAPDATWIACKGCKSGSCDDEQLIDCATYLVCPDKKALNCTTRPHIINNSWGGGIGKTTYDESLKTLTRFGIINIFASGNSGPICSTVASPADGPSEEYHFLAVGATACNDNIASYSSNGPSQAAAVMGKLKPDIVGPGSNIYSAWNTNDTATNTISGTSMSSPNVAGAAAVLLSSNLNLTYEDISFALREGAYRNTNVTNNFVTTCNITLSSGVWPNNIYGYGRVDLYKSMQLL